MADLSKRGRKRKLPVEQAEEVNPKRSRKHEMQEQQAENANRRVVKKAIRKRGGVRKHVKMVELRIQICFVVDISSAERAGETRRFFGPSHQDVPLANFSRSVKTFEEEDLQNVLAIEASVHGPMDMLVPSAVQDLRSLLAMVHGQRGQIEPSGFFDRDE